MVGASAHRGKHGRGALPSHEDHEVGVTDAARTGEGLLDACVEPYPLDTRLAAQEQRKVVTKPLCPKPQKSIVGLAGT